MNDHGGERGLNHSPHEGDGHGERSSGPAETGFLNLEMSKIVLTEAEELAKEVGRELLRDAIRERLKERFGDRLRAVGLLVADAIADDMEANLAIEAKIQAHKESRKGLDERVREALAAALK